MMCSALQADSFLSKVWQVEQELRQSASSEKTTADVNKPNPSTAYLNKDVQLPVVIENQIKGTITFKQGREITIVNERHNSWLIAIGTFSYEIKKEDVTLN